VSARQTLFSLSPTLLFSFFLRRDIGLHAGAHRLLSALEARLMKAGVYSVIGGESEEVGRAQLIANAEGEEVEEGLRQRHYESFKTRAASPSPSLSIPLFLNMTQMRVGNLVEEDVAHRPRDLSEGQLGVARQHPPASRRHANRRGRIEVAFVDVVPLSSSLALPLPLARAHVFPRDKSPSGARARPPSSPRWRCQAGKALHQIAYRARARGRDDDEGVYNSSLSW